MSLKKLIEEINERGIGRQAAVSIPKDGERSIDSTARTVEVAFASETDQVERWFGIEILDHGPDAVDLSLINDSAPVLDMHDRWQQVGVVQPGTARVDSDRISRADLRYSQVGRGAEIFTDIVDGIRTKISVGYRILDMVLESQSEDGPDVYRITKWQPYEISNVSLPADNSVGVGRSAIDPSEQAREAQPAQPVSDDVVRSVVSKTKEETPTMTPEEKAELLRKAREEGTASAAKRTQDILDISERFDAPQDMVGKYLRDESLSIEQFSQDLLELRYKAPAKVADDTDIGMSARDLNDYSFTKLLRHLAHPDSAQFRKDAAFELECANAAADKRGSLETHGLIIPSDVLSAKRSMDFASLNKAGFNARAMSVGTAAEGGNLVATDLLASSFIDLLRNRMVLMQLGATTLTDLTGNIAIPRQSGAATGYWLDTEGGDIPTEGLPNIDQVGLTPKNVGAFTEMTRSLLKQSSIDVENFIRADLARVLALTIDLAGLYGTGANGQPTGIASQSAINTVDFAGVNPNWAEVVQMETEVAVDNADFGSTAYAMGATMRGHLKSTEKFSNGGKEIWGDGNMVNGYDALVSNQIPAGDMMFGNWADVLIGMWGGLDMLVNPYSGDKAGTVRVTAFQSVDVAVRHPESFCHGKQFTP